MEKLTEVEFNFRELVKVFCVVDCRHIDWKSCRSVSDHEKREIVNDADEGDGEDVDASPDVLPVDRVEPGQLLHLIHSRDPEWGMFLGQFGWGGMVTRTLKRQRHRIA